MRRQHRIPDSAALVIGEWGLAIAVALAMLGSAPSRAGAASSNDELEHAKTKLDHAEEREGVLTSTLSRYSGEIDSLQAQIATLHTREGAAQEELASKQGQLDLAIACGRVNSNVPEPLQTGGIGFAHPSGLAALGELVGLKSMDGPRCSGVARAS